MILEKVNNWLTHAKQYFFTYKEGFFFLSYISNTPKLIVESSKKLPFIKTNEDLNLFYTDNPFVKSTIQYVELEEGLWVLNSKVKYKNNVAFTAIYDNEIPADYYCFTINIVESNLFKKHYHFNKFVIENKSISFLKPKKDFLNCHFKGSFENQYIIYFNHDWAQKNIFSIPNLPQSVINLFEDDAIGFVNYKFNNKQFENIIDKMYAVFNEKQQPNVLEVKKSTFEFITILVGTFNDLQTVYQSSLNLNERIKINQVELYLLDNLYNKFPGIETIAAKYKISATKLKTDFKKLHGTSILQFFQAKQMDVAFELLKEDSLLIKDIAKKFQYENFSKFSKTFQKHHGVLPSQIKF